MKPAWSVVLFTTLAGMAQGLVVTLALAELGSLPMHTAFLADALALAVLLLLAALVASVFHLGRPERAWRAMAMWRTSWLSREVIVLPAFIGTCALWWLALRQGWDLPWLPLVALLLAAALWLCTAMIYACLRFIQEWAQPLTLVNFVLIGLGSGMLLACTLAAWWQQRALLLAAGPVALALTLAAAAARIATLRRNARLTPKSTLQSATGVHTPRLMQVSMGMTAGAFNTREFFHGRSARRLMQVRVFFLLFAFSLPALLLAAGLALDARWPWTLALLLQAPGLVAERWFFLAQAPPAEPVLPGRVLIRRTGVPRATIARHNRGGTTHESDHLGHPGGRGRAGRARPLQLAGAQRSVEVSLGVWQVQASLGLVVLAFTAALALLFIVHIVVQQAGAVAEGRLHAKELAAQRELADRAEASRFNELREHLDAELRRVESHSEQQRHALAARVDGLQDTLLARLDESTRSLSAYVGEVDDKLDRLQGPR